MKNRKKRTQIEQEKRNALYHKVIIHNQELAQKNTGCHSAFINTKTVLIG